MVATRLLDIHVLGRILISVVIFPPNRWLLDFFKQSNDHFQILRFFYSYAPQSAWTFY
jgi:hypothetical protein